MDLTSLRSLLNSISRFIHLLSCCTSWTIPLEKDYRSIASFLKQLKPVLDDIADCKDTFDESLSKECEELDSAVNEARTLLEKWSPKMSKILCVLESKPLLITLQISIVKLSRVLYKMSVSSPANLSLSCAQESQNLNLGKVFEYIDVIVKSKKGDIFGLDHLKAIIESIKLRSNEDFLSECIALEKQKQKAQDNRTKRVLDQISQAAQLMTHIRDYMVRENVEHIHGVQIPPYFRCPLSLELMLEPVILSSGHTYECRAARKWLDHGLETCPITHQKLSHKNLIPNYTVKALILSWCDENKVKLSSKPPHIVSVECHSEEIRHRDGLQGTALMQNSTSGSKCSPLVEERNGVDIEESKKFDLSSLEHSSVHSRSESASSAVSSIEYLPTESTEISGICAKQDNASEKSVEITSASPTSSNPNNFLWESPLTGKQYHSVAMDGNHKDSFRTPSLLPEAGSNDLTTTSHIERLIEDLKSKSTELQTAAAGELRFLAKHNVENRFLIGQSGAIPPLISLLNSDKELIQEHAVTTILNLSINEKLKANIGEEGALEPLIHVLRTGTSEAKENAAAALFSLSLLDDYRMKIGRSSAVKALVDLLGSGSVRGKKDAATALFNLSIFHENKARIIQAGAVKHLVPLLDTEMADKAVALLANLSTIGDGCTVIAREGGIPSLVEILDTGSQRGKENAASVLMQLCISSTKYCRNVLQEGAVPPLVALTQSGTPRAKEKAQQLLSHFRNQRGGVVPRGRS
ncbi:U-box domain-containing protein 3 [Dorcoceras hygrometricum]|uniref:RING-type E3 ubiquitin transferase n=1 Tax=Dorcoceras hygrometricum TaxID=472368 RepID=A0A2Z7AQK2_9LAMI|nr:U-box domain-containing protein 3 [Dorcoceras hygrometricum]